MAVTGISEFTFGFAFLYEQTLRNFTSLEAIPILPSLKEEADKGYDAKLPIIGTYYFYQFKLSDYLSGRNAKYLRSSSDREPYYTTPYYRFTLHPHNNFSQHRQLKKLAAEEQNTFYVAPEIHGEGNFKRIFLEKRIFEHSRLIPLANCEDIDVREENVPHDITFQVGKKEWTLHSKPKLHETSYNGLELLKLFEESRARWEPIDRNFSLKIHKKVLNAITEANRQKTLVFASTAEEKLVGEDIEKMETPQEILTHTSRILFTMFGATMVLVGAREHQYQLSISES